MNTKITVLLLLTSLSSLAQERRYFTPYFQKATNEKTKCERIYDFKSDKVEVQDISDKIIVHKAEISGLSKMDEIDAFFWYCLSSGAELNYKDYFQTASGNFLYYDSGKLSTQVIVRNNRFRYAQVFDKADRQILVNGSGQYRYLFDKTGEESVINYKDSLMVSNYLVRAEKGDTIYLQTDEMATPKEGVERFYQRLYEVLKYPGFAKLVGKQGRVYISFLVNEKGKLTEFTPLTNVGFRFERKTIEELEKLPDWKPAIVNKKPVTTRFTLPVKFQMK